MTAQRVGVLMGGWGEERERSVKSGEAIAAALERRGHPVTRIIAGPRLDQALRGASIDLAFLALHGRIGEDGKVQGLLEVMGIPYTGSGVLASALAMNKGYAKKLFRQHNLASPVGHVVSASELARTEELHFDLGFPCIVKPVSGGSSVGLSVVHSLEQLRPAVAQACRFGGEALIERLVRGRELTVAVLGDAVLGSLEVSGARYLLPSRLSSTRVANVEAMALAASRALGCRGYARVDLICSETANDVVLEVNTLPGLTPHSPFSKIARHAGVPFEDLCVRILSLASTDQVEPRPNPEFLQLQEPERHVG